MPHKNKNKNKIELQVNKDSMWMNAQVRSSSFQEETSTVTVEWTSGAEVKRWDWWGNSYYEVLGTDEKHIKLDRLNAGAPFLLDHWASISNQIGVVRKAWMENGKGLAEIQLSRNHKDAERIIGDIKDGILKNVSVGYVPLEYEEIPTGEEETPRYLVKSYEPLEISLVAVPADAQAQVRNQDENKKLSINVTKRGIMPPEIEQKQTENKAPVVTEPQQRSQAEILADERNRVSQITRAAQTAGIDPADAISKGESFESFSQRAFDAIEKRQADTKAAPQTATQVEVNEVETRGQKMEAMADAVMHRSGMSKELSDRAREFRGMNLIRMAEEALIIGGMKASELRNMSKSRIATRALASSDFALLTGAVLRKSLARGYNVLPPTFWPFVTKGSLPDYKETTRVKFGTASDLKAVAEGADYTYGQFEEDGEKTKLAKYGRLIKITDELIINDDLGALTRLTQLLGQAAARIESNLVYGILVGNPLMEDGKALFHADHKNLAAASAIDVAGMGATEKLMLTQKGLGKDADYLNVMPKFLIVGADKKLQAQQLLGAITANEAGKVNPYVNALQLIVDPRVTGNKWFLSADPATIDTIEVSYLDGEEGPQITEDVEFKSDCQLWKVKHVVAAKAMEHRGLVYNPGA